MLVYINFCIECIFVPCEEYKKNRRLRTSAVIPDVPYISIHTWEYWQVVIELKRSRLNSQHAHIDGFITSYRDKGRANEYYLKNK